LVRIGEREMSYGMFDMLEKKVDTATWGARKILTWPKRWRRQFGDRK